ncbi:MAG: endonuclease/exonuclease/phosphatase family protein [Pseudomonadota bacterium]
MRALLVTLGLIASLGVIYGAMGTLHRSADSIAMLGPALGLFMVIGAYATRRAWLRVWMGLAGVLVMANVLIFLQPQDPGDDLRVYTKNLRHDVPAPATLAEDIMASRADVVLLQEISPTTAPLLATLSDAFPHQHICRWTDDRFGIAVLSRSPFAADGTCSAQRALAAAQIDVAGTPVWLVSVHLPWPWPSNSAANDAAASTLIDTLDGAIIAAGDFNVLPWSGRLRRIRAATATRLAGPMQISYRAGALRAPIDHVLAPGGGALTRRPLFGSDHFGLLADLSL